MPKNNQFFCEVSTPALACSGPRGAPADALLGVAVPQLHHVQVGQLPLRVNSCHLWCLKGVGHSAGGGVLEIQRRPRAGQPGN